MTDRRPSLSDVSIERALAYRAPHGADDQLLAEIVATAEHTPQRRTWRSALRSIGLGSRYSLVWVALALTTTLLAGLLLSGSLRQDRPDRPDQAVVPPIAIPSARLDPSPTPDRTAVPTASTGLVSASCSDTASTVQTGAAMPADSHDRLVSELTGAAGVFLTQRLALPGTPDEAEVWSAGQHRPARQLAKVTGPDLATVRVVDVSSDGTAALIMATSPLGVSWCADLYLVRTDASGATRIATFATADPEPVATFSPDGHRVAYPRQFFQVDVTDLGTGDTVEWSPSAIGLPAPCDMTPYATVAAQFLWSPDGSHLAIRCVDRYVVIEPGGSSAPAWTPLVPSGSVGAAAWEDETHLLVVEAGSSVSIVRADLVAGTARAVGELAPIRTGGGQANVGYTLVGASPDMKRFTVFDWMSVGKSNPRGHFTVVDAHGTDLGGDEPLGDLARQPTLAWSSDNRSIAYVDYFDTTGPAELRLFDLESKQGRTLAVLPVDYHQGIWRLP